MNTKTEPRHERAQNPPAKAGQAPPRRKRKVRVNFMRLGVLIIVAVGAYVSINAIGQQSSYSAHEARQHELEAQHEQLQYDLEYYQNQLNYVGSDDYVEQAARTRLGWLMPGEIKYVEGAQTGEEAPAIPAAMREAMEHSSASPSPAASGSADPSGSPVPGTGPGSEESAEAGSQASASRSAEPSESASSSAENSEEPSSSSTPRSIG